MTDESNTLRIRVRNGPKELEIEGAPDDVWGIVDQFRSWLAGAGIPEPVPLWSKGRAPEPTPAAEKRDETDPESTQKGDESATFDLPIGGQTADTCPPEAPKPRGQDTQADHVIAYLRGLGDKPLPKTLGAIMAASGVPATSGAYLARIALPARGCRLEKIKGLGCRATFDDGTTIESPAPAAVTKARIDYVKQPARRFTHAPGLDPENLRGLPDDHRAIVNSETLFPSTVVDADDSARILVSGQNSPKIGDRVTKGAWKGMPIFTVTLEERATCPDDCHMWAACYGNGMPLARRHRHGPRFEALLEAELAEKQRHHPEGFVVRLHVLGDFYSAAYVQKWRGWLDQFPALRVFGYTAWSIFTPIGIAVSALAGEMWSRFAVRFSSAKPLHQGATVLWRKPEGKVVPEGIVCPAMLDGNRCCGNCGLCWATPARDKTVVFVAHGNSFKGSPARNPKKAEAAAEEYSREFEAVLTWLKGDSVAVKTEAAGLFKVNGFGGLTPHAVIKLANDRRARRKPALPPFVVTEILKPAQGATV